ncbi:hypothetical protein [Phyllobacterium myrsinacearum]|uniref:Uncharacterized protein n=1 Tax=Phyllobacterium myrsinacearum TaxID=28101 RepID=A0A2S9JA38_9HYPH|nr:hypothetical protein [Phyllobacterium myrsinacearum]PRD49650.1 hypothetical protein C5750_24825 [Phyllobacterium myrsinacearum]PWV94769.1 hypothetical protein DEV92_102222 [Phyllobacterium myrsinacearum]RZV07122.1 hypothetical protein EV654_1791 [Phyllobacterium myrsinacearum]
MAKQSINDRILSRSENGGGEGEPAGSGLPRPGRLKWFAGIGAVAVAGAALAFQFYPPMGSVFPAAATAQAQAPAGANDDTPFRTHISQAGIRTCANLFPALGQALTFGSTYAVNTQWNKTSPDAHPVQAVAGMSYDTPEYKEQAAGVVVASPTASGCEGTFVRVAPFQKPCQEVITTLPQGSTLAETLSGTPYYNLANNGGQALLIASGNSCVVVSVGSVAG